MKYIIYSKLKKVKIEKPNKGNSISKNSNLVNFNL
jgi:hypothetical protein